MKNVMITGAGRGIGLALTKEFLKNGWNVLGTYRDPNGAKDLLKLKETTQTLQVATADVTDEKSFAPVKDQLKKMKTLDVLINNSGVIGDKGRPLMELDLEALTDVLQVNTLGPMRTSRIAIPFLSKDGKIAQITSLMGSIADNGSGGYYDYRMSKAALNMFNMCLTREYPQLTCLALHPGWVQTDMGGAGATLTVDQCASGLYKVITTSAHSQSGKFFDYSGKELPW